VVDMCAQAYEQELAMIDVRTGVLPGAAVRVSVVGEIDMAAAPALEAALAAAVDRDGATRVEIDFAGVTFCDSIGIAALDRAYATASRRSLPLRLLGVRPAVARVLDIIGILDALTSDQEPVSG
jgi:anti-sigma B factor antagonist